MENRAAYLSKQKFYPTPPLPPKYSMLKHFDVIPKLVPSKDHFNNKKHYKCKNTILKKIPFFTFSKTYVSETGCHGNMINHMDMVTMPKSLHTAGAREILIDQSAFSGREKF